MDYRYHCISIDKRVLAVNRSCTLLGADKSMANTVPVFIISGVLCLKVSMPF
jgi:hypothetical protein